MHQHTQSGTQRTISIHRDFSPTWDQIEHYVKIRSNALPFCGASEGHQNLWRTVLEPSIDEGRSRTYIPGSKLLAHVTVKGIHGIPLRIADFYSALGLIITETDPWPFSGRESQDIIKRINHKMLATFMKWIYISARGHFADPPPNTASPEKKLKKHHQRYTMKVAVSPNLSGWLKDDAVKLQQANLSHENLERFLRGLGFEEPSQLAFKLGEYQWGHCAETLALLYMLEPSAAVQCLLSGVAANMAPIGDMAQYNHDSFQTMLKPACENCQLIFRTIDHAMRGAPGRPSGSVAANSTKVVGGPFVILSEHGL
ncbi:hypothetical protein K438DRAFT_2022360 [Mycena galopus ATCC 62051]|nr:hypothetical protein K438DRAFT_2022360 [Mycena galopus ATCC 62051]